MFLTSKEYDLKNFLTALNFIPPKGMSVTYFISPQEIKMPASSGFAPVEPIDMPEDESITYQRQLPVQKQDQAQTPGEYSVFNINELGRRPPTPNVLPEITEPEDLESPFIKIINESKSFGTDIKLIEDYMMFPKGTLFHCELNNKLIENKMTEFEKLYEGAFGDWAVSKLDKINLPDKTIGKGIVLPRASKPYLPMIIDSTYTTKGFNPKKKKDAFVRKYWLKHYPDEAGKFYAEQDEAERQAEIAKEYEEHPEYIERDKTFKMIDEQLKAAVGYRDLKSPNSWKSYLDQEAVLDSDFMGRFHGLKDMKRKVVQYLYDSGRISKQIYSTCIDNIKETGMLVPPRKKESIMKTDDDAEWGPGGPNGGGLGVYNDNNSWIYEDEESYDWSGTGLADDELDEMGNIINEDDPASGYGDSDEGEIDAEDWDMADYEDEEEPDWDDGPMMSDDISYDPLEESTSSKLFNRIYETANSTKKIKESSYDIDENTEYTTIEIDWCDQEGDGPKTRKELSNELAQAFDIRYWDTLKYKVVTMHGPGGGWPVVRINGPREDLQEWLEQTYDPEGDLSIYEV